MSVKKSDRQTNLFTWGYNGGAAQQPCYLDRINEIFDWSRIATILESVQRGKNAVGRSAYPALMLFKCLLLQRFRNVGDRKLEFMLTDSMSARRFVGLLPYEKAPDYSTICRFRNSLLKDNVTSKVFEEILQQIARSGLLDEDGFIIDSSVIDSARHPSKLIEPAAHDRNEPDLRDAEPGEADARHDDSAVVTYSDDEGVGFLIKGHKLHYGRKLHMVTGAASGLILDGYMTPANHSDMKALPKLVKKIKKILPEGRQRRTKSKNKRVYADKGFSSRENREAVKAAGLKDGILQKKKRGGCLTKWQQRRNRWISSARGGIERIFGTLKVNFDFYRSRYLGTARAEQEFRLVSICFNLKRVQKLCSVAI